MQVVWLLLWLVSDLGDSPSTYQGKLFKFSPEWCLIKETHQAYTHTSCLTSLRVVIEQVPWQVLQLLWKWSSRNDLDKFCNFPKSGHQASTQTCHLIFPKSVHWAHNQASSPTFTDNNISSGRLIKHLPGKVAQLSPECVSSGRLIEQVPRHSSSSYPDKSYDFPWEWCLIRDTHRACTQTSCTGMPQRVVSCWRDSSSIFMDKLTGLPWECCLIRGSSSRYMDTYQAVTQSSYLASPRVVFIRETSSIYLDKLSDFSWEWFLVRI